MQPNKKFKNQFDTINILLSKLNFKSMNLNKKDYSETYTQNNIFVNKGVRSDFIKLYRLQYNNENTYTIGFGFSKDNDNNWNTNITISKGLKEKSFIVDFQTENQGLNHILNSFITKLESNTSNNPVDVISILNNTINDYSFSIKKIKIK